MTQEAIVIRDLSFNHGISKVLREVSVSFPVGQFSVLLGKNGSGKSTLFNIIAGIERYQYGQVEILGHDRKKLSVSKSSRLLGFLPQFHKTVFPFSVLDVVLTGRAAYSSYLPSKKDRTISCAALDEMGLVHLQDRPYTSLSGGERQLVMLARVLVQSPSIIMLDEPTNHLDLYYQSYVLNKLRILSRTGYTVIATMHDPNQASLYGDNIHFMHDGKVLSPGMLGGDKMKETLEHVYGVRLSHTDINGKTIIVPQT